MPHELAPPENLLCSFQLPSVHLFVIVSLPLRPCTLDELQNRTDLIIAQNAFKSRHVALVSTSDNF